MAGKKVAVGSGTNQEKILVEWSKEDVAKAYAAALTELIRSGDYARILARWNLSNEAVPASEINPPGLPLENK